MKRSLPFVLLLLSFLLISSSRPPKNGDTLGAPSGNIEQLSSGNVEQLSHKQLQKECERLRAELTQKEEELKETQKKLDEAEKKLASIRKEAKHIRWKLYLVLLIIVGIVGTIVYIAIRNPKVRTIPSGGKNCCPRCGWKYHDGETECKNCHTHF